MAQPAMQPTQYQTQESVTVSTASKALTAGTYGHATHALITVETAAVRFWLSGTAPTASVGHVLEVGDSLELHDNKEIANIRFIRRDASDATLRASYGS